MWCLRRPDDTRAMASLRPPEPAPNVGVSKYWAEAWRTGLCVARRSERQPRAPPSRARRSVPCTLAALCRHRVVHQVHDKALEEVEHDLTVAHRAHTCGGLSDTANETAPRLAGGPGGARTRLSIGLTFSGGLPRSALRVRRRRRSGDACAAPAATQWRTLKGKKERGKAKRWATRVRDMKDPWLLVFGFSRLSTSAMAALARDFCSLLQRCVRGRGAW